jgi:hypothetical protein
LSSSSWKLLGVLLLVVVVVTSVESFSLWKPVGEPTTSLFSTSGVQSTVAGTTLQTSVDTTMISYPPTQWIAISSVRSVSYYLSLFDSNGTQPYLRLGEELRRLPDLTNATAVATITYLALNATNPEVKEAFSLMIRGGTPDQTDFSYTVPSYNTELQVLYWLACQNQFKKNDTLALAIAMVNGLWVTMGDDQVSEAVKADATGMLAFLRETNELQRQQGYYQLEDYPFEAKLLLAWTGGMAVAGPVDQPFRLEDFHSRKINLDVYDWNVVSLDTLRKMQVLVYANWIDQNVTSTFSRIEEYFYFSGFNQHMDYQNTSGVIVVDNETVPNHHLNNVDWEFQHFEETGKIVGVCNDEASFVSALAKSVGIATTEVNVNWKGNGHTFAVYFDPAGKTWRMYGKQMLNINISDDEAIYALVFRPPVYEGFNYRPFTSFEGQRLVVGYPFYLFVGKREDVASYFVQGFSTETFKLWLLSTQ